MNGPIIEHWVVTVARAAGLDGVKELHLDSGTPTSDAWNLVAMAAGVGQDELARRVGTHFRLPVADLEHRIGCAIEEVIVVDLRLLEPPLQS